jgi:hypothetical protein
MPGKEIKGRSKRVMYSEGSKGKTPTTPKEKKFAALAPPPNKITFSDKIVGATKNKRTTAMAGGMMRKKVMGGGSMMRDGYSKGTHVTKDGRTVQKGLYYNMNQAKKKGTSKPGKGSVTDKALKQSAKTAFKG